MIEAADARRRAPATERNRAPILEVLSRVLPKRARLLEVSSGTGEHAVYFAASLPGTVWQPTDVSVDALASIDAWRVAVGNDAVLRPVRLDVLERPWPVGVFDALFCANMIHIAPWECCVALFRGAAEHLREGGVLVTYGPYFVDGEPTAPSNLAFDASLRSRDERWGLRSLADVVSVAGAAGFTHRERVAMPANNLMLTFVRDDA